MSAARITLERLLRKGERAQARGVNKTVALALSSASCPEYAALDSLSATEYFHAEIRLAERAGAVRGEGHKSGRDGLARLHLLDLDKLAAHLDVRPLGARVGAAADKLAAARKEFPIIDAVLADWARNRKVRGKGPEAADDLADAARVVKSRCNDENEERILRRESVRLFRDSKRVEALTTWLDLLVCGELASSGLAKEDVWATLGLRREPQPMLLAGAGVVHLMDGDCPLQRPYLGVPVEVVRSISSPARHVLTIENLASFHDAARIARDAPVLLVYTGGMPSPAWRAAYARILCGLPAQSRALHWGDIDEGGFRIAAVLSATVIETGRRLFPWLMSPDDLPAPVLAAAWPANEALPRMCYWAERAGWDEVAAALRAKPMRLEQESLPAVLPADSAIE